MGLFDAKGLSPGVGSVVGGALSAVGSLGSGIFSALSAKSNRDWQERQASIQRQWEGMPAQVMRARQAGLNPNLVFGQGSGVTNAPAVPSAPSLPVMPNIFDSAPVVGAGLEDRQMERPVKDSEAYRNMSESQKASEEAHQTAIENQTLLGRQLAELRRLEEEAKKASEEALAAHWRQLAEQVQKEILDAQAPALKEQPSKQNEKIEQERITSKAQAGMYKAEGEAAVRNARTNERIASATEQKTKNDIAIGQRTLEIMKNQQNSEYWKQKMAKLQYIIAKAGAPGLEVLGRLQSDVANSSFNQWEIKVKKYVQDFPLVGNLIDAVGGFAQTYATLKVAESVGQSASQTTEEFTRDSKGNVVTKTTSKTASSRSKATNARRLAKKARRR